MPFVDDAEAKRIEAICDRVASGDSAAEGELNQIINDYH